MILHRFIKKKEKKKRNSLLRESFVPSVSLPEVVPEEPLGYFSLVIFKLIKNKQAQLLKGHTTSQKKLAAKLYGVNEFEGH